MSKFPNKFVIDGVIKLDLTSDTVVPDKMALGYTAHDASGAVITGTLADGDELEYGTEVLSDLTGTTWYIDAAPTLPWNDLTQIATLMNLEINSTSNGANHSRLIPSNLAAGAVVAGLYYDDIFANAPVYTPTGGWVDEAYRTITFTGGAGATNAAIITWIQANATRQ